MASESMREKIARAAHDAQWDEPFPQEGSIAYAVAMQVADAVLDALMEPTDRMIEQCWPLHHPWGQNAPPPNERASFFNEMRFKVTRDWRAMIRAAKDGA